MSAGEPLLRCSGLDVAYDHVRVLFGVDFEVHAGEVVALLGSNGAGKTTLLKTISGLLSPRAGSIVFDGREVTRTDVSARARDGIVQVPAGKDGIFPTLTVIENLRAAAWMHARDRQHMDAVSGEVFERFPRLGERRSQMAGNLSGGEQQMLTIGMALMGKPKLLMIDELTLGLAPVIVERLLEIVQAIHAGGAAVLLVEQSVNTALNVAQRACFMEKGEIRFSGATEELLRQDDVVRGLFFGEARTSGRGRARSVRAPGRHEPVLEVVGLDKRFGGIHAVAGVSFTAYAGEIVGVIGPNGAGKTTVFDLVSGFEPADAGRVVLDGRDVTALRPDLRAAAGLGRSFQDSRIFPSLTVAENLSVALERHLPFHDHLASMMRLPEALELEDDVAWTVEDLLELTGLGAERDKLARDLSTGTRRTVDLGMAIAHDPTVLLLDEPSSGIAQRETDRLGELLERIRREVGCAMVVIEHDMALITAISHRMIALDLGALIAEGSPSEVVGHPQVVASYLGGQVSAGRRSRAPRRRQLKAGSRR